MRKGFRPSLEPPLNRRVDLDGRRPLFCVFITAAVIILIIIVFSVSAWSLYSHQFTKNMHRFHAGDQVALLTVTDDLTPVFCDGYEVTLTDQDKAYLLPHRAHVNQSRIATSQFAIHHQSDSHYSSIEVYLLRGSALEIGACRENGSTPDKVHILLIKGEENFNNWRINPLCSSCVLRHMTLVPSIVCNEGKLEPEVDFNITISDSDQYELVVHYEQPFDKGDHKSPKSAGVIVHGVFDRTRYDTKDSVERCGGRRGCYFDLDWGSTKDIVIGFGGQKGKIENDPGERTFTTKCSVRYAFWILVFAGSPVLLSVPVASLFAWFLCRRSRKPSLKKLSRDAEKRRVRVRTVAAAIADDAGLMANEVIHVEVDESMAIQD